MTLKPGEHNRVTVRRSDYRERQRRLQQQRAAQNALAHAYQLLQERAVAQGRSTISPQDIKTFRESLSACRDGRHADAEARANDIRLKLQNNTPVRQN